MLQVAFPQVDPRAREEGRGRGQGHFLVLGRGKGEGPPSRPVHVWGQEALDDKLRSLGFRPERREGDRDCEVNYRRLQATVRARVVGRSM